jgi:hypothetical protein
MATEGEEGTWREIQQRPARARSQARYCRKAREIFLDVHFGDQIGTQEDALRHVPVSIWNSATSSLSPTRIN